MNPFVKLAVNWVVSRLKEPSTWAGLTVSLGNAVHINFNADFRTAVVHLGLAIGGLAAVVLKEGISK